MVAVSEINRENFVSGEKDLSPTDLFPGKPISPQETIAISIIQQIPGLNTYQMRDLFFYLKWTQDPRTIIPRMKNLLGEVREDEKENVIRRIHDDEYLFEKYDEFHRKYLIETEQYRIPQLMQLLREGLSIEDAASEADMRIETANEIFPLRKFKEELVWPYILVLRLRLQGKPNRVISESLSLKRGRVERTLSDLALAGIIEPDSRGEVRVHDFRKFCNEVKELRGRHLTTNEIAKMLNCLPGKVHHATQALIRIGEIEPYRKYKIKLRTPEERAILIEKIRLMREKKLKLEKLLKLSTLA